MVDTPPAGIWVEAPALAGRSRSDAASEATVLLRESGFATSRMGIGRLTVPCGGFVAVGVKFKEQNGKTFVRFSSDTTTWFSVLIGLGILFFVFPGLLLWVLATIMGGDERAYTRKRIIETLSTSTAPRASTPPLRRA